MRHFLASVPKIMSQNFLTKSSGLLAAYKMHRALVLNWTQTLTTAIWGLDPFLSPDA